MIEKLIENWLIEVNELGYQIPFCEALLAEGYSIIHISSHGPGEHGKDVIARDAAGKLWTFQLKGGDIRLSQWREIRGEVEELVRLPVSYPGISELESHIPVLVTNGEIRGDAQESIKKFANMWGAADALQVWSRRQLLALFIKAHGKFLPTDLRDVRQFVELYVADFRERLPREKLSSLLISLVDSSAVKSRKILHQKRAIESMALIGGYIAQQYAKAGNHVSEAEAWTIIASTIFHVAARESLDARSYSGSLRLVETAIGQCLNRFEGEVLERLDFLEPALPIADPVVYGPRVLLTLGWLAASRLSSLTGKSVFDDQCLIRSIFLRETKFLEFLGEADWPSVIAITLFMERLGAWRDADTLLEMWSHRILRGAYVDTKPRGFPYPYWLQEKVLNFRIGALPPSEEEDFLGRSYTLMSALDMLVRRLCRQAVNRLWTSASRINECDFMPDRQECWFEWTCEEGATTETEQALTVSWKDWRARASALNRASVPSLLVEHPRWILPFALTFPHRCTRSVSALADCMIGLRGSLRE